MKQGKQDEYEVLCRVHRRARGCGFGLWPSSCSGSRRRRAIHHLGSGHQGSGNDTSQRQRIEEYVKADTRPQFIPYGASLTNLFVKDKNGSDIDVVLGYDDVSYYR